MKAATVTIEADLSRPARPVNRLILGSNTPWFDRADGLMVADGTRFDPQRLGAAKALAPTSLRYPGGTHADLYRWRAGIGPPGRRGPGTHAFSNLEQPVIFGTDEFLLLCALLGAEPLITVNLLTADAREAAEWLAYVNDGKRRRVGGVALPRVRYWELGNEPYLIEATLRSLAIPPAEYARRVNAFTAALRRQDPAAKIGVALRSDRLGGVPATPYPGFNPTVLGLLEQPPDFAAVHNAYAPYTPAQIVAEEALHLALMAAPEQVAEDLEATATALRQRWPDQRIALAVTEYSAFFDVVPPTDRLVVSLAAALYVADLLRVFALRDDILMANHWSLSGNWMFGAIGLAGERRPVFEVLSAYARFMHGEALAAKVGSPMLATAQVGMVAPRQVAAVTALALRQRQGVVLFLINKDPFTNHLAELRLRGGTPGQVRSAKHLTGDAMFGDRLAWAETAVELTADRAALVLPRRSLTILALELARGAAAASQAR